MALGAGKYDAECARIREAEPRASAVMVIIVDGSKGDGFACHATLEVARALPSILRAVADDIERNGL